MELKEAIEYIAERIGTTDPEELHPLSKAYNAAEYADTLLIVLSAAEKFVEIEGWAKTPSGIWNYYTAAGYANAQFDVMQILEQGKAKGE